MEEEMIAGTLDNKEILEQAASYYDDQLAIIENLHHLNIDRAVKMEDCAALLCTRGKATIYINDELYDVKEGDLVISHPNVIIEHCMVSVDFECCGFLLSPAYIGRISVLSANVWDLKQFIEGHPVISLNAEEVDRFRQYFGLLRSRLLGTPIKHQKEVVDCLLRAFAYEFHDSMERFYKVGAASYSSGDNLFKTFIEMLTSSYPKARLVASYAQKLNISPKYLSTVCKEVSGHTASELINQYVVKDIEYLLKRTRKSIKEIAEELDFPNLSFFGKYVKRYLGMSPRQYRDACAEP